MTVPAGFTPVDGGWGRSLPATWQRQVAPGIWQQLHLRPTDGTWAAAVHLDAPWTVFGAPAATWRRRVPDWWAPSTFAGLAAARAFLDAHSAPSRVVDALLDVGLVRAPVLGADPLQAVLDAVAVLIVDGQVRRAAAVVDTVSGASPAAADRLARLAARAGLPAPRPDVVRPADLADVVALITRTISADLPLARTRRWARRWIDAGCAAALRPPLSAVTATASPHDTPAAVARWQDGLERLRAAAVHGGGGWPSPLPGVDDDPVASTGRPASPAPPPTPSADPLLDRRFEAHGGRCVHGRPADGRQRVDLFFDYSAFPVWFGGGAGMASPERLGLTPDLAADLWSWSHSHDRRTVPGGRPRAADAVARHETARLRLLGARLERATGLAAVVQQHRGSGDGTCPTAHCLGTAVGR